MTHKLHRVSPHLILRARMEVEALEAEKRLGEMSHEDGHPWRAKVTLAKEHFEHALVEWAATRARYWELKKTQWANSEGAKHWKEKLAVYESRLDEARLGWHTAIQSLQKVPVL